MFRSMQSGFKKSLTLSAFALAMASSATAAFAQDMPKQINFGIIATDAQQNLSQRWEPLLQDLSEELGVPVKAYFAPDYAGIIQGQRFGKVDFAYYGNKSAIEAVDRADAEIFARYIDLEGQEGYYSLLVTNKDNSDINTLEDVIEQRSELNLGNGDPNSTSGFLVPNYYAFAQNNVSSNDFKRSVAASHGANLMAVANKRVDVATNNSMNLLRLQQNSPDSYAKIKVVWQSVLIPSDVVTYRKALPEEMKAKAKAFFINYGKDGNKEEINNLHKLSWSGFAETDNNQLLPIRQLEAYKELVEAKNNTRLDTEEKNKRVKKLTAEIETLQQQMDALKG
ncbi:phosphonate ABC transporter substrate-binding protein [Vibrio sp. 10N.286.49.C2]|uniref:phosphonate ABC transporter substrate-binding protein n=1 Tax=unclassified Vibrio TaxID=2614977 RepID=UPI000C83F5B8|nr:MULTISPECIES: phosphonate ABC transporter substrate-binding protein [unclassified Vibrio]PMH36707.1 phosphonate ABC transporter substrate-binding protein [Vibrio sp. 10N.286.49.C2]PMH54695.1 phosphonate ABC transporter substrate-binding protein [Vibrio sp. 10N.286.49.B1]PMH78310.1 phosphonate ABC transporter substrate-binding protein [Vibrio sp. 10N.286.48.B7]